MASPRDVGAFVLRAIVDPDRTNRAYKSSCASTALFRDTCSCDQNVPLDSCRAIRSTRIRRMPIRTW